MPKTVRQAGGNQSKPGKSASNELPPCEGPKLKLFEHHDRSIEWLERLGNNEDGEDGSGSVAEGYVFRARIAGREYAVKIFKFFDPLSNAYYWGPLLGSDTDLNTAAYYTDPFYAECRAYGRMNHAVAERKLRKDAAIRCHGYLFLRDTDQQRLLKHESLDLGLDSLNIEYQENTIGGLRIRAIVKDLASNDPGVETRRLRTVLARIKALNKQQIYNRDIRLDNFRDGQLVDFGTSWTEPHVLLDALDEQSASGFRLADKVQFDRMLIDEEIQNPEWIRAMANRVYRKRLRPKSRK